MQHFSNIFSDTCAVRQSCQGKSTSHPQAVEEILTFSRTHFGNRSDSCPAWTYTHRGWPAVTYAARILAVPCKSTATSPSGGGSAKKLVRSIAGPARSALLGTDAGLPADLLNRRRPDPPTESRPASRGRYRTNRLPAWAARIRSLLLRDIRRIFGPQSRRPNRPFAQAPWDRPPWTTSSEQQRRQYP